MGYYTDFDVQIEAEETKAKEIIMARIKEVSGYSSFQEIKWYACEENMRAVSGEFPDTKITVYGNGEDSDDLWVMYCFGGNVEKFMARIEITYPEPTIFKEGN